MVVTIVIVRPLRIVLMALVNWWVDCLFVILVRHEEWKEMNEVNFYLSLLADFSFWRLLHVFLEFCIDFF